MLRNSWRIDSLARIDLKLHVTFPLVVDLTEALAIAAAMGEGRPADSGRERAEVATS